VWKGGASIFMRGALAALGDEHRVVWCADSFEGLPAPNIDKYPQDKGVTWHLVSELGVSLESVKSNFKKFDLLDDRVKFPVGWFKDTLAFGAISNIGVLGVDGDMYESATDALGSLYSKVSPGGFVIVDDYGIPEHTCRRAIQDFRTAHSISEPIVDIASPIQI